MRPQTVARAPVWPARRLAVAFFAAVAYTLFVAIPTDLIDTGLFSREIAPTWWSWPALLVSAALAGLLTATYVKPVDRDSSVVDAKPSTGGYAGGLLTFFAVGCPVCNKLVLLALGSAGAITWFEPVQPFIQIFAIGLLLWALRYRLRGEKACRMIARSQEELHA